VHHFSLAYVPHNTYLYYFHPGDWSLKFPFVSTSPVTGGPSGYLGNWSEAICGIAVSFPFVWIALALPLAWRAAPNEWRLRAILGSLTVFYLAMSLAILSYYVATVRYMADFAPTLGLLALCGWLGLERWATRRGWNKVVTSLASTLCVATAIAGILVTFDYHGRLLQRISPEKWDGIRHFFSHLGL
jgi:hypothetical protein